MSLLPVDAGGPEVLVMGLGNVLCADDGAGIVALDRLARAWTAPPDVELLDGGTLGLALLPLLRRARRVVLLDAVAADAPPGTLLRLEGRHVGPAVARHLSPHQVGVADLLDGARLLGGRPEQIVLLGVVPASLDLAVARSPEVEAALPRLVDAAAAECARFGHPLALRPQPGTGAAHRALFEDETDGGLGT
ncbi:MAG: hydrogenase maturation protease [Myxococcota bacterium]